MKTLIPAERKEDVLRLIREEKVVTIKSIMDRFKVSKVTVHRILNDLENERHVLKVRGGVKIVDTPKFETRYSIRLRNYIPEKAEIAQKALRFIEEGDSIFLESSTTGYYLARALCALGNINLTIITNGPEIAAELSKVPNIHVIMTGGELEAELNTLVGPLALYAIERLQFCKVFFTSVAVSPRGVMTSMSVLFDLKRKLVESGREINLIVDSSKFYGTAPHIVAPLSSLTRIITDSKIPETTVETYKKLGVVVIH